MAAGRLLTFTVILLFGWFLSGAAKAEISRTSVPGASGACFSKKEKSLGERATVWLVERGLCPEMAVVAVSMLPVVELRGALPIGLFFFRPRLTFWKVLVLSVLGNIAPIPVLLLVLGYVMRILGCVPLLRDLVNWLLARTRQRSVVIQKSAFWGLVFFVGIPLPGTGAWTGALAAWLLGLPYWHALASIFAGVLIAGAAVSVPCLAFRQNPTLGFVITGGSLGIALLIQIVRTLRRLRAQRQPDTRSLGR
ncbi:MAG: small multi-drug export protein [candidate division WOR-3 bacterium]